jgi:tetratricopeptide (TPR) repeat protein
MKLLVAGALLVVAACNGKKDGTTPQGGDGNDNSSQGHTPDLVGRPAPVQKELSVKAKAAFQEATKDVQDVLKGVAEKGGKWSQSDCEKVAEAFGKVAKETAGEKDAVAQARFNEGVAWSKCQNDDKASTAYRAALSANPRYAPAKVNMAEMYTRQGNTSSAWETFLQAFMAAPEDVDANYNLAVLLEQKDFRGEMAPPELRNFWKKLNFDPKTAGDVAELHLRMVLAKSSAGKSMRDATLNLKAYSLMALMYYHQSRHRKNRSKLTLASLVLKEAQKVLQKEIVKGQFCKDPEKATYFDIAVAQMRNIAGLILLRREQLVEAMYRFEAALKCNADFIEAHMNRAAIALGFRGYWIAHDSFQRVLKLQPRNLDATVGLGVAYRGIATDPDPRGQQKQKEDWYKLAVAQYEASLKLDPNASDAIYNLGYLYMDYVNDINLAEKWYKEYLNRPPRTTDETARREVKTQLDEIVYQREIAAKMAKIKTQADADRLKREEEEKRRKEHEAMQPMTAPTPPDMGETPGMPADGMPAGMN